MNGERFAIPLVITKRAAPGGTREIEGMATTRRMDRAGDIVEPWGGMYRLPVPFLWNHDHGEPPIGSVTYADPRPEGIFIRAKISDATTRAREVWQLIADGILDSMSIGFRVLDFEPLDGGGRRFTKWELLEISACSVPCNPDAKMRAKSLDAFRAELGRKESLDAFRADLGRKDSAPRRGSTVARDRYQLVVERGVRVAAEVAAEQGVKADVAIRMTALHWSAWYAMHEIVDHLERRVHELEGRQA